MYDNENFKSEYILNRHKNSKTLCIDNVEILEAKIKILEQESLKTKNTCKFCNSEYSYLYSLQRHLKESCKSKQCLLQQRRLLLNK